MRAHYLNIHFRVPAITDLGGMGTLVLGREEGRCRLGVPSITGSNKPDWTKTLRLPGTLSPTDLPPTGDTKDLVVREIRLTV